MIGIYKITNPKGRVYIGQSVDIENRFYLYRIKSCHKQQRLYASLKKYGVENHIFEIIEECEVEDLNCKERYWQEYYNVLSESGMNCVLQMCGEERKVVSEEMKKKISIANSGERNGMYGKKHSEERLKQLRNHRHTDEAKAKISKRSKGANSPTAKLVLNLETGIYYGYVGEASEALDIPYSRLKDYLNGHRKNRTSMVYC